MFRWAILLSSPHCRLRRSIHHRRSVKQPKSQPPPPPPPSQPRPPQKPVPFTVHGVTWHDPYSWMSNLSDPVSMRHMDIYMEQEEKYTEAVFASLDADRLTRKLQIEMATRMATDLCTTPVRWGPWLYYRRVEEGKQYPVLCRRSASLNEEFISYSEASAGFDFTAGKRIEQKLVDYNVEAERFGGYSYEELSEISPDHRYLAYTMYDKEKDSFTLSVRDLATGSLCDKPHAERVANLSWAMSGKALIYTVTNSDKRPFRIYCSMLGSSKDDVLILEESDENVYLNIRSTKDFQFVTVNIFSNTYSKVYLIHAADPLSGMKLVWESEPHAHCIVEHHQGCLYLFTDAPRGGVPVDSHYLLCCAIEDSELRNWENVILEEPGITIQDVDFCNTHMVLHLKDGKKFQLCSIALPLPVGGKFRGGGGSGKKWHQNGKRMRKKNSIQDYISCAEFLIEKGIVQENKLAGWGYSAGGLLVASAINIRPSLFHAAVLKVPFLDACNTLLYPILPLTPIDYEEFGYPVDLEEFLAIRKYSPYDNIQKDVAYPAVLVTSSFNTRFGVWEAAKWVARVREMTTYDPKRPVLLNLTTDIVEDNKYLQTKELAMETAFLIKMMTDT